MDWDIKYRQNNKIAGRKCGLILYLIVGNKNSFVNRKVKW